MADWSGWLGSATAALSATAKGAAAGSVVPGIGTGIGAIIGLATELVPDLAKAIGVDSSVAGKVVQTVQAVTGTTDPGVLATTLSDPAMAADLRVQLAQIAADHEQSMRDADLDRFRAAIADTASARQQTVDLARANSGLAWGAPVISAIVLLAFGVLAWLVMFRTVPEGSMSLASGLLEAFKIMSVTIVGYWCGSSAGSAQKTRLLADKTPSPPNPGVVVPAEDVQPR